MNNVSIWLNNNRNVVRQWLWGVCPYGWGLRVRYWVLL